MTPEGKVKSRIRKRLDELGCWYFMPPGGAYGKRGIPDFVGCYNGKFFAIEAKAGKGTTTVLQDITIKRIRAHNGIALVVNEDNVDTFIGEIK